MLYDIIALSSPKPLWLLRLRCYSFVQCARGVEETKAAVMQNSGLCACLVDAAAIADINHVAGAVCRALCRERDALMTTRALTSEIFLCLNAKKSVSAAFAAYGISSSSTVLLLLWLDDPQLLRLPDMLQQLHLTRLDTPQLPLQPCSPNPFANMKAIAKAFAIPDTADAAAVQAAVLSRVAVWDL